MMTNENRPKVRIVIGNDRMDKIGFTNILRIPKTIAKIMVVPNES